MAVDEERFRSFVEGAIGGRVVRLERAAVGSSRVTLRVDAEDAQGHARQLVVRHDSGDGPLSGTEINLANEARFYRALADHPVRIPRLIAEAEDGLTLLVERAPGTESLGELSEPDRQAVQADFGRALAELHAVDSTELRLGDLARPREAADHALLDLARWARLQCENVADASDVSRLAIDWLGKNPPRWVERTVLCHGDAGIGNFLHDGRRVTALLDWEFAHLGDPLDDVAWVLVRSHVTGGDAWRAALTTWSEQSAVPLEPGRIAYYRAMVLLRMAVSCEIALSHARPGRAMDTTVYRALLPYLEFLMPQALREAGCREPGLDALEQEATKQLEASPIRAVARPLVPWEPPA